MRQTGNFRRSEPPAAGCRSKSYVKLHPKTAQRGFFLPALTASTSFHEVLQEARMEGGQNDAIPKGRTRDIISTAQD